MCKQDGNGYNCTCAAGYIGTNCENRKYLDSFNPRIHLKPVHRPLMIEPFAKTSVFFFNLEFRYLMEGYNRKHSYKIEPVQDL